MLFSTLAACTEFCLFLYEATECEGFVNTINVNRNVENIFEEKTSIYFSDRITSYELDKIYTEVYQFRNAKNVDLVYSGKNQNFVDFCKSLTINLSDIGSISSSNEERLYFKKLIIDKLSYPNETIQKFTLVPETIEYTGEIPNELYIDNWVESDSISFSFPGLSLVEYMDYNSDNTTIRVDGKVLIIGCSNKITINTDSSRFEIKNFFDEEKAHVPVIEIITTSKDATVVIDDSIAKLATGAFNIDSYYVDGSIKTEGIATSAVSIQGKAIDVAFCIYKETSSECETQDYEIVQNISQAEAQAEATELMNSVNIYSTAEGAILHDSWFGGDFQLVNILRMPIKINITNDYSKVSLVTDVIVTGSVTVGSLYLSKDVNIEGSINVNDSISCEVLPDGDGTYDLTKYDASIIPQEGCTVTVRTTGAKLSSIQFVDASTIKLNDMKSIKFSATHPITIQEESFESRSDDGVFTQTEIDSVSVSIATGCQKPVSDVTLSFYTNYVLVKDVSTDKFAKLTNSYSSFKVNSKYSLEEVKQAFDFNDQDFSKVVDEPVCVYHDNEAACNDYSVKIKDSDFVLKTLIPVNEEYSKLLADATTLAVGQKIIIAEDVVFSKYQLLGEEGMIYLNSVIDRTGQLIIKNNAAINVTNIDPNDHVQFLMNSPIYLQPSSGNTQKELNVNSIYCLSSITPEVMAYNPDWIFQVGAASIFLITPTSTGEFSISAPIISSYNYMMTIMVIYSDNTVQHDLKIANQAKQVITDNVTLNIVENNLKYMLIGSSLINTEVYFDATADSQEHFELHLDGGKKYTFGSGFDYYSGHQYVDLMMDFYANDESRTIPEVVVYTKQINFLFDYELVEKYGYTQLEPIEPTEQPPKPTEEPTEQPPKPTEEPTEEPTEQPTEQPVKPTEQPTEQPVEPTEQPVTPTTEPQSPDAKDQDDNALKPYQIGLISAGCVLAVAIAVFVAVIIVKRRKTEAITSPQTIALI